MPPETFKINICRVSETCIQNLVLVITPLNSKATLFPRSTLSTAHDQAGVGIALTGCQPVLFSVQNPASLSHDSSYQNEVVLHS